MKLYFIFIIFVASVVSAGLKDLKLLQKGTDYPIEWSLYLGPEGKDQTSLILVIKNYGAKFVPLKGLGTDHFSLETEKGKKVEILRINGFENVMHQSVMVGHIVLRSNIKFTDNYIFKMKEKKTMTIRASINTLIQANKVNEKLEEKKKPEEKRQSK